MMVWKWTRRGAWVGLLVGLLAICGVFEGWERLGYDARAFLCARFCGGTADAPITVVLVDDASLAAVGRWPWPRATLAALLGGVFKHEPAAVGLDVILSEPAPGDAELAAALRTDKVVLPVYTQGGARVEALPILAKQGSLGHIEVNVDRDGIVRSVPAMREGYAPFGVVAARLLTGRAYREPGEQYWLDLRPRHGAGKLSWDALANTVSAVDVISGKAPREAFAGRLVFIGIGATGTAGIDAHVTSLRPLGATPGVYIHAGMAASEINGRHMRRPGRIWELLLAVAAGLAGGMLACISTQASSGDGGSGKKKRWHIPSATLVSTFVLLVMYSAAVMMGHVWSIWLPWVAPVVALVGTMAWMVVEKQLAQEWERQGLRRLFSRYVPSEVIPELLQRSSELGLAGVQRDVAVLFVDVRGFTALAEPLLPVQVMQVLNLYLEALAAAVRQHGGMVDKYLGDGLMAVFGAPVPLEDTAKAAVSCALDMHIRVSQLTPPPCVRALPSIGVGVHFGDAVLGTVGGRERLEYTAMGDVVNVAARLEEMAPAGSIILSGDVVERLSGSKLQGMCKPLGVRQVRGKRQQLSVYEIRCVLETRSSDSDDPERSYAAMEGLSD